MSELDRTERVLAAVLAQDALDVEPGDRLAELQAATRGGPRMLWPVAAAAAVVAAVGGVALAGTLTRSPAPPAGDVTPPPATVTRSTAPSPTPSPTTAPTGSPSPTAVVPPAPTGTVTSPTTAPEPRAAITVPVYYVGDDGGRTALFREFHRVEPSGTGDVDPVVTAVREALDGSRAIDPDYRSLLSAAPRSVTRDGSVVTVDLPASQGAATGVTREQARVAVQGLAWTASAAAQDVEVGVRVLLAGGRGLLFDVLPVGDVARRPPSSTAYEDLASIWVTSPAEEATTDGTVRVAGTACVAEASFSYEVLSGATVVRSGTVMASNGCPVRGDWSVTLSGLAPGDYTFRAFAPPLSGEGPPGEDTRRFTVR